MTGDGGEEGTPQSSSSVPMNVDDEAGVSINLNSGTANSSNGQLLETSSPLSETGTELSKVSSNPVAGSSKDRDAKNRRDSVDSANVVLDDVQKNGCAIQDASETINIQNNEREPVFRVLGDEELIACSKDQLICAYQELSRFVNSVKKENGTLRDAEEKLRMQQADCARRENVLVMRLTTKEQELQDYIVQINELKQSSVPTSAALRNTLVDPAVNLLIQRMKKELEDTKKKLEDTQNDLNAWKFTPDSNTGKRLMAKCRMLYQENEDLGKMISSGRLAKLESDLALQRSLTDEMKKSQSELDELIQELDEDVEGMQGTIYYLQQQLRNSKADANANANSEPSVDQKMEV